jgi:hypothetical protein
VAGLLALWLLTFWLIGTGVVAYVAMARGRHPAVWAFLALILSPIFVLLALAAMPANVKASESTLEGRARG